MTQFVDFRTTTGIVVPAAVRQAVLSEVYPFVESHDLSDVAWYQRLPLSGQIETDPDWEVPFSIDLDGTTTLRSFSGELSHSEVQMLRGCITHANGGGIAILSLETGSVQGDIELLVCNGNGTVSRHEAVTVFPSFEGAQSGMAEATAVWASACGSALVALESVLSVQEERHARSFAAPRPARPERLPFHDATSGLLPGPSRNL